MAVQYMQSCDKEFSVDSLAAAVSMLHVNVNESPVRKTLNKADLFGRISRGKPRLSKMNMAALLCKDAS